MTWLNKYLTFNLNEKQKCNWCNGTGQVIVKYTRETDTFIIGLMIFNLIGLVIASKSWWLFLIAMSAMIYVDLTTLREYKEQTSEVRR